MRKAENIPDSFPDGGNSGLISVIIPTLNEGDRISMTLAAALRPRLVECIVSDGNSSDNTRALARTAGARVVIGPSGRSVQMNRGAAAARGDIFLFLHGDTLLPMEWDQEVRRIIRDPAVAIGAFRLGILSRGAGFRLVEWGANLRSRFFSMAYGDQALFVRRFQFIRLGSYQEIPFMEDLELVRRYTRHGRLGLAVATVRTSPRRWQRLGIVRTTLLNQALVGAYAMGVSPKRLAEIYHGL